MTNVIGEEAIVVARRRRGFVRANIGRQRALIRRMASALRKLGVVIVLPNLGRISENVALGVGELLRAEKKAPGQMFKMAMDLEKLGVTVVFPKNFGQRARGFHQEVVRRLATIGWLLINIVNGRANLLKLEKTIH